MATTTYAHVLPISEQVVKSLTEYTNAYGGYLAVAGFDIEIVSA